MTHATLSDHSRKIVMLGTRFGMMGGISSVVGVYRVSGLFERWPIVYLCTHQDGSAVAKLKVALSSLLRYVAMLLRRRVSVVHLHVSLGASFWRKLVFFSLARLFRVPTIVHLHSGRFHEFYEEDCRPLEQRLIRYVFNSASHVIVLSEGWKQWLVGISSNPRVSAIYNPVQVNSGPLACPEKGCSLLSLGRLGRAKGTYDLLDAVAATRSRFPEVAVTLGGDGEIDQVREYAVKLGISGNVHIPGWLSGDAKTEILMSSSIYCLPSYHEGLPMSVLEAMSYGIPVVASSVGGIPEVIDDGKTGYLIQAGDATSLSERIHRLLADPEMRQQMGAAARRKVESTFSVSVIFPKIGEIYESLGAVPC